MASLSAPPPPRQYFPLVDTTWYCAPTDQVVLPQHGNKLVLQLPTSGQCCPYWTEAGTAPIPPTPPWQFFSLVDTTLNGVPTPGEVLPIGGKNPGGPPSSSKEFFSLVDTTRCCSPPPVFLPLSGHSLVLQLPLPCSTVLPPPCINPALCLLTPSQAVLLICSYNTILQPPAPLPLEQCNRLVDTTQ